MYFPRSVIFDYTVRLAYSVSKTDQVCRLVYTFESTEDNKRSLDKEAYQRLQVPITISYYHACYLSCIGRQLYALEL